jgi:hypothetical protein
MPVRAPDWVIVTTLAAMPALKSVVADKLLNGQVMLLAILEVKLVLVPNVVQLIRL